MKTYKYLLLPLAIVIAVLISAIAELGAAQPEGKVQLCHVTASASNPYVLIEVAPAAFDGEGKNDHTRHVQDGRVDVLAIDGTCPGELDVPTTTTVPATTTTAPATTVPVDIGDPVVIGNPDTTTTLPCSWLNGWEADEQYPGCDINCGFDYGNEGNTLADGTCGVREATPAEATPATPKFTG